MPDRRRLLALILALYVVAGGVLRIGLFLAYHEGALAIGQLLLALAWGVLFDALTGAVLLAPAALWLSLSGGAALARGWARFALLALVGTALVFGAAVEVFFFDEFNARFNHIAVDYVLFPGEVFTNIWQSYNVPLYVAVATASGALLAWPLLLPLRRCSFAPLPARRRLLGAGATALAAALAVGLLMALPAQVHANRITNEIAQNGLVQLVRAFATSHLDYEAYYHTLPAAEAAALAAAEFATAAPAPGQPYQPVKRFTPAVARARPLDVVVILEESLGSEFVGALKGPRNVTPGLDRWTRDGLLCTNLVAIGNRTVRGLEGVLCSFLPLPGDSVVKRDKSENVASVARVLKRQGYRTEFFYGGAGTFDHMKPFMADNGWDAFIEDGIVSSDFPPEAYRTAWGVADQYIFDSLLAHQRQAAADGKPFLGTLLSVSNHKPFLTPDTRVPRLSHTRVAHYLTFAGVALALCVAAWFLLHRRLGAVRLGLAYGVVAIGMGVLLYVRLQPTDTRENAVRYSDRALASYLDQAKAAGLLEHTVVLVVGDHGARVYGSQEIPAASYRIPALFLAPEARFHGAIIDRLCSQIDLLPTALSLAGVTYEAPFLGQDLLQVPLGEPGRAFLNHNRDIGMLTDTALVVLGLQKQVTWYRRESRASDAFTAVAPEGVDGELKTLEQRATAAFQTAYELYEHRRYVLPEPPAGAPTRP
jgi:phosphoglycerol transferase MdoB-like AlkP superfamily enzyme